MRNTSRKMDLSKHSTAGSLNVLKGADGWTTVKLYRTTLGEISFSGCLTLHGTSYTTQTTIQAFNTLLAEAGWGQLRVQKKNDGLNLIYRYNNRFNIDVFICELEEGGKYDILKIWQESSFDYLSLKAKLNQKEIKHLNDSVKWDLDMFFNYSGNSDKTLDDLMRTMSIKRFETIDSEEVKQLVNQAVLNYFNGDVKRLELERMLFNNNMVK